MFSFKKLFFPYNKQAVQILTVLKRHTQGVTFDNLFAELTSSKSSGRMPIRRVESYLSRLLTKDLVIHPRTTDADKGDARRYAITERGKTILREGLRYHVTKSHIFVVGKAYRLKGDLRVFTIRSKISEGTNEFNEGYRYIDNFGTIWREDGSYETAKGRRETKARVALEMTSETFAQNQEAYL